MPAFNVKLTDESHAGWDAFAAKHGITVAALQEILGRHLDGDIFKVRSLEQIVTEARELAHERRRAGGPRRKSVTEPT